MRITFVNTLYPPLGASGAETTLRFLAQALSARGHDCTVVTLTPERQRTNGTVDAIQVHYLPLANAYWPHGGKRPAALRPIFQALDAYNPVMEARLGQVLDECRPDVVHAHNLQGFSVSAWRAAHRRGIPLVQTLHDYYTACPRSAMWRPGSGNCAPACAECRLFATPRRLFSSYPAAVTVVSHRVFDRITATGMFEAARKGRQPVRVIRGNNPSAALPPLAPRGHDARLCLGFMGRLDQEKGIETLLDALSGLADDRLSLALAGTGQAAYAASLQRRAGANPAIRFLGHVAPDQFFREIDVLVVPSVWEDPFPRVFHEALAYGVPTLATPLGGLQEAIEPGRTGFVATAATASALAEAIRALPAPDALEAIREHCREAAARYAPERIVGQYEAVLAAAASGHAPPEDAGEVWRGADPEAAASTPRACAAAAV